MVATTETPSRDEPGEVMGPVADQRCALLAEGRDHELSLLALGEDLPCDWVDDLAVDVVVPEMDTVVVTAVDADSRTVDLGQTVDVVDVDAQVLAYGLPGLDAPELRTDYPLAEPDAVTEVTLPDLLREKECIR